MAEPSIWDWLEKRFTADEVAPVQMRPYRCPACMSTDTYPVLEEVTTFGDDEPYYITNCWIKCSRCHTKWLPPKPTEAEDDDA